MGHPFSHQRAPAETVRKRSIMSSSSPLAAGHTASLPPSVDEPRSLVRYRAGLSCKSRAPSRPVVSGLIDAIKIILQLPNGIIRSNPAVPRGPEQQSSEWKIEKEEKKEEKNNDKKYANQTNCFRKASAARPAA